MGRIFLSYASDDRSLAKDIQARLRQHGHDVFFDEDQLKPSDGYDQIIQRRIGKSDVMIFLCSSASLRQGRYTLTELEMAQRLWPSPQGRILPVLVGDAEIADLPSYIKGLSAYRHKGDAVSEITSLAEAMVGAQRRKRLIRAGAMIGGVVLLILAGLLVWNLLRPAAPDGEATGADGEAAASAEKLVVTAYDLEKSTEDAEEVDIRRFCPGARVDFFNDIGRTIALRVYRPGNDRDFADIGLVDDDQSANLPGTIDATGWLLRDGKSGEALVQARGDPQAC